VIARGQGHYRHGGICKGLAQVMLGLYVVSTVKALFSEKEEGELD